MNKAQKALVSSIISALSAALLAGCGARSELVDGVPLGPRDLGSSCAPAFTTPFAQRFGDGDWQTAASIAVDAHGYPVIAGAFVSALDLGVATLNAPVPPPPDDDLAVAQIALSGSLFVARLAPLGCSPFALAFSPMKYRAEAVHVALDDDGAVLLSASYRGLVDFGGGPLGAGGDTPAAAIAKLGPTGEHRWSHALIAGPSVLARPASDAQGNVFVAGLFGGQLRLDDVVIKKGDPTIGGLDVFVVKLDPAGTLLWSKTLRLGSSWSPYDAISAEVSVAAWPEGDVAVAGHFQNDGSAIDLGGGPLSPPNPFGGFVTSFDASGQHRWASLLEPDIVDVQLAPSGTLVALGGWNGHGYPLHRFDTTGAPAAPVLVDGSPAGAASLAVGAEDEALIAIRKNPKLDTFGIAAIAVAGSGETLWKRAIDPPPPVTNESYRLAAAFGPSNIPILAGGFTGALKFATGPISTNGGGADVFVAALEP